jgi:hypothetical protein
MTPSLFPIISSGSWRIVKPGSLSPQRVTISEVEGQWQASVKQRLEELIRLEEGWDGYTAFPVSFDNAMFAFRMLESICRPDTLAPQIVPGPSGDLQIEWHTHEGDIELWVRGPNNVHAWRSLNDENGEEIDLTNDFSVVSMWVKEVTEPTIAFAAAA